MASQPLDESRRFDEFHEGKNGGWVTLRRANIADIIALKRSGKSDAEIGLCPGEMPTEKE
jgi:hypothetical protein